MGDELALIVTLIERLTVVGAGLPKQHRLEVNGHQEVVANRAQMKALEEKVRDFREFARARGLKSYVDAEVVDVPPATRKKRNGESTDAIAG